MTPSTTPVVPTTFLGAGHSISDISCATPAHHPPPPSAVSDSFRARSTSFSSAATASGLFSPGDAPSASVLFSAPPSAASAAPADGAGSCSCSCPLLLVVSLEKAARQREREMEGVRRVEKEGRAAGCGGPGARRLGNVVVGVAAMASGSLVQRLGWTGIFAASADKREGDDS
ncbi:hypothetical protein SETIT_7G046900v2 [Setaria italica]|uniref:Uncharacterized protein n=1 Tax=Setaria italica TaxID=4555 RepID=A0A368RRW6_SETIT|nr:hypothetical protein SETIT_7G046900v2 [Setaria italica]